MRCNYYDGAVRACWSISRHGKRVWASFDIQGQGAFSIKELPTEADADAYAAAMIAAKRALGFRAIGDIDDVAAVEQMTTVDPEHALSLGLCPYQKLGPLLALQRRSDGSIAAAELSAGENDLFEPVVSEELLMALLRSPFAARMESLYIGIRRHSGWSGSQSFERQLRLLGAYGEHPALRRLLIRGDHWVDLEDEVGYSGNHLVAGPLDPVLAAFPGLEKFEIAATFPELSSLHHDHLQRVLFDVGVLPKSAACAIATARLPAATELKLKLDADHGPSQVDLHLLADLWIGEGLPRLEALSLCGFADTDALIPLLASSPLVKRLRRLSLANGHLSGNGVERLIAEQAAFAHLERLDLTGNRLRGSDIARLRETLPTLEIQESERVVERLMTIQVDTAGQGPLVGSTALGAGGAPFEVAQIGPFLRVVDARDIIGADQSPFGPVPYSGVGIVSLFTGGPWRSHSNAAEGAARLLEAGHVQVTWAGSGIVDDVRTEGDGSHDILQIILRMPSISDADTAHVHDAQPWPIAPGVVRLFDEDDFHDDIEATAYQVTQPARLRVAPSQTAGFVYARRGSVSIAGTHVPQGHIGLLSTVGDMLWIDADEPFEAIVGTGCPLDEALLGQA